MNDKTKIEPITLTIDGIEKIEFKLHTFYQVLSAFIEQRF